MFYYGIGSKRVMASPANWGEKDPIQEFAKQLRNSNDKENWRLAKKLDAKVRTFAPVIIRGEESEGVKLWQLGPEVTGTPYNKTTIGPSLKTTGLAEGEEMISALLENQADPMKVFKPLSYDEMKLALQEWLAPEDSEEGTITSEPAVAFDNDKKESNYSLDTKPSIVKKSKADQFDDLFQEIKTEGSPFQ